MLRFISKEEYQQNVKNLENQYEAKKAAICKKYGIKPIHYDMICEIISNEDFKNNIKDLAKKGARVEGESTQTVIPC